MSWIEIVTIVITSIGLLNCVRFCFRYWYRSNGDWKSTEYGQFFMALFLVFAGLFSLIISSRIWGVWPGRAIVATALYAAFVAMTFWPPRLLSLSFKERVESGETKQEES